MNECTDCPALGPSIPDLSVQPHSLSVCLPVCLSVCASECLPVCVGASGLRWRELDHLDARVATILADDVLFDFVVRCEEEPLLLRIGHGQLKQQIHVAYAIDFVHVDVGLVEQVHWEVLQLRKRHQQCTLNRALLPPAKAFEVFGDQLLVPLDTLAAHILRVDHLNVYRIRLRQHCRFVTLTVTAVVAPGLLSSAVVTAAALFLVAVGIVVLLASLPRLVTTETQIALPVDGVSAALLESLLHFGALGLLGLQHLLGPPQVVLLGFLLDGFDSVDAGLDVLEPPLRLGRLALSLLGSFALLFLHLFDVELELTRLLLVRLSGHGDVFRWVAHLFGLGIEPLPLDGDVVLDGLLVALGVLGPLRHLLLRFGQLCVLRLKLGLSVVRGSEVLFSPCLCLGLFGGECLLVAALVLLDGRKLPLGLGHVLLQVLDACVQLLKIGVDAARVNLPLRVDLHVVELLVELHLLRKGLLTLAVELPDVALRLLSGLSDLLLLVGDALHIGAGLTVLLSAAGVLGLGSLNLCGFVDVLVDVLQGQPALAASHPRVHHTESAGSAVVAAAEGEARQLVHLSDLPYAIVMQDLVLCVAVSCDDGRHGPLVGHVVEHYRRHLALVQTPPHTQQLTRNAPVVTADVIHTAAEARHTLNLKCRQLPGSLWATEGLSRQPTVHQDLLE
mmetsp:Transcript_28850/g.83325  ORF Transcript_28850/g.83325 Transcript_28850/m.83325 type:complete len:674 (-) Transcript_28850:1366-3387(-)